MKLLKVESKEERGGVIIEAFMDNSEFRQLSGCLDNIVSFPAECISEQTKAIKTGARHNHARYFLLPVKVRRTFKADTHDFENIRCSCIENDGKLFVVFCLEEKASVKNK